MSGDSVTIDDALFAKLFAALAGCGLANGQGLQLRARLGDTDGPGEAGSSRLFVDRDRGALILEIGHEHA